MGRYTGPKGRVNRRLGVNVYESNGAIKALERKEFPPGMHKRRKKPTNYGLGLAEKQKIKFYYGLRDRQLFRYFDKARRMKGNTGAQLMILCERRLDNVVRRAGFAATRPQARQGIVHRHFQVNGVTVSKPGMMVRAGDVISLRKRPNVTKLYKGIGENITLPQTEWINFDQATMTAIVRSIPTFEDVGLQVDINSVVAFLSR
ncbi:MAG: 30S ribosomal protein S4 [Planctomycetaceae bacterium]|nr:30S ribosomal protein S4 [Planctomycetaceae bacterium]